MDQASLRVLRWRYEGLLPRLAQALLISVLLWFQLSARIRDWAGDRTRSRTTIISRTFCRITRSATM